MGKENFAEETDHHSNKGKDSTVKTGFSNLLSDGLKLKLERSHILLDVHGQTSAANKGV